MDVYIINMFVLGLLLLFVTLGSGWIARIPLSNAQIYLVVGIVYGPYGFNLIQLQPDANLLQRLAELVVIVSVFSCGLKMNRPLRVWAWNLPARLIGLLMPISIFGVAAVSHWLLGMSWRAAVLLGAILAPTDPVLASEVQLSGTENLEDRSDLRFSLTSEGGLNDALAFPFVYFGLHWIKDDNWEHWFRQWVAVDVVWAIAAAIVMGIVVSRSIIWIDHRLQKYRPADALMEDFVALSTIFLTYSLTELVNGYGFLAVFVAGIVVQRNHPDPEERHSQFEFTEQIEKLLEVVTILLLGSLLQLEPSRRFAGEALVVAGLLVFVIRPVGTWISTIGSQLPTAKRWLIGWFGIRGVGSLYYLSYALGEGLQKTGEVGQRVAWITYLTVVISTMVHGTTSTPLMRWYEWNIKQKRT